MSPDGESDGTAFSPPVRVRTVQLGGEGGVPFPGEAGESSRRRVVPYTDEASRTVSAGSVNPKWGAADATLPRPEGKRCVTHSPDHKQ